jgi:endonuclease/exonuclease/phosphatase family metal-dependent hydrolase
LRVAYGGGRPSLVSTRDALWHSSGGGAGGSEPSAVETLTDFDSPRPEPSWQITHVLRRNLPLVGLLAATLVACTGAEPEAGSTAPTVEVGGAAPVGGAAGTAVAPGGAGGLGTGGQGAAGGADVPQNQASLVTWNLEGLPHSAGATARVAEILRGLAPDVVALEEVADPAAFDELIAEMPGYAGILNDDPSAYTRLGLLYRQERVAVSEVEPLSPDSWSQSPRPPLKARFTIDAPSPIDFVAVVIHLKAQLDADSQARRLAASESLDAWLRGRLDTDSEQDYVLLGDFNDELTDAAADNVFNPFLTAPDRYSFLTLPLAEAGEHSYIPFVSLIDHVLVTSDMLGEVGSGQTEVLPLEQTVSDYASITDHRPVRSWLHWGS